MENEPSIVPWQAWDAVIGWRDEEEEEEEEDKDWDPTAEDFSCYPLEEDEIQPPQSSDDEGCPHMLSSAAHHWLWSPATGWQRAREVDAESVAA